VADQITDPILREAAGLDPILAPLQDRDLLKTPVYEAEFTSVAFPALNGKVRIRYANVGDTMDIEAMALGGGFFREAIATLTVCTEQAPASWYTAGKNGEKPMLDLRKVADAEAVADLYKAYASWRDTFRKTGQ
jgi:hypothetical protein